MPIRLLVSKLPDILIVQFAAAQAANRSKPQKKTTIVTTIYKNNHADVTKQPLPVIFVHKRGYYSLLVFVGLA